MAIDKETLILEVARKHFVQRGYAATRMQDIADEAGSNKALVHYYFRSKEKLYHEITVRILDTIIPRFAQALTIDGTFWERVEAMVGSYVSLLQEQPDIPFFIMSEVSQKQERFIEELKKRSQYFPALQGFIILMHQEMEAGKIRTIPPIHLMLNIMGMTVFPFLAKPFLTTVFGVPEEDFSELMGERKEIIINFLKAALNPG
jgi:AcrR family transcriptional regulator